MKFMHLLLHCIIWWLHFIIRSQRCLVLEESALQISPPTLQLVLPYFRDVPDVGSGRSGIWLFSTNPVESGCGASTAGFAGLKIHNKVIPWHFPGGSQYCNNCNKNYKKLKHYASAFEWNSHKNISNTRMWANAQRDGRPAELKWRSLFNAAVWLTPTTTCCAVTLPRRQTNETISAASGPKFTILWGHLEDILLRNKFFSDCRYVP